MRHGLSAALAAGVFIACGATREGTPAGGSSLSCPSPDHARQSPLGGYPIDALPAGACSNQDSCQIAIRPSCTCPFLTGPLDAYGCDCVNGAWLCRITVQGGSVCLQQEDAMCKSQGPGDAGTDAMSDAAGDGPEVPPECTPHDTSPQFPQGGLPLSALPAGPCDHAPTCEIGIRSPCPCTLQVGAVDNWRCACVDSAWSCAVRVRGAAACAPPDPAVCPGDAGNDASAGDAAADANQLSSPAAR
jgi:hypothetical protein